MRKIFYHIGMFFLGLSKPKLTQEQMKLENELKSRFFCYFDTSDPDSDISRPSLTALGITSIEFKHDEEITIVLHLNHPGILIGKRGAQIAQFEQYLSRCGKTVRVDVKDTQIWKKHTV